MGAVSSKNSSATVGSSSSTKPGQHSPLPEDVQAYQGPLLETSLVAVPVKMTSHFVSGRSAGQAAVTSDVDQYYPMIAGYLEQGYTLNTFYRVPGKAAMSGFSSAKVGYECLFSRPVGGVPPPVEVKPRLLIEKSTIYVQQFRGGILNPLTANTAAVVDTSDILNKIYHQSTLGSQLICIEPNGDMFTQGTSAAMAGVGTGCGVDVLFEVPPKPGPAQYVYQVVNVPVGIKIRHLNQVTVECDWLGILASHLNQGWKLVEIFLDMSQQRAGGYSRECTMNSIWFFEKEASKLNDPAAVYEGAVMEYYHKVSMGFGGTSVKTDWSPVITEMARRGWELACIQETPEATVSGFGKVVMKLMMFFQRKIIGTPNVMAPPNLAPHAYGASPPYAAPPPNVAPPPYAAPPPNVAPPSHFYPPPNALPLPSFETNVPANSNEPVATHVEFPDTSKSEEKKPLE